MPRKKAKNLQNLRFKSGNRKQSMLLPPLVDDWIDQDHPARLIDEIVDQLDIDSILKSYGSDGAPIYHPGILLKILFYGYLEGDTSSRILEKRCRESLPYMWLTGMQKPDHATIASFRSGKLQDTVKDLFAQVVKKLFDEGLLNLQRQTVDGTTIEAVPNRYRAVWRKNIERHKKNLEAKIVELLSEVEQEINAEKKEEGKAEEETSSINSTSLRKRIEQLEGQLEEKKVKKKIRELKKRTGKLQEYEYNLIVLGNRNSYAKTDPDATYMRLKEDQYQGQAKAAYNIQVSSENNYVVSITAHQNPSDNACYIAHTNQTEEMLLRWDLPMFKESSGDAAYGVEEIYEYLDSKNIEAYLQYSFFHREQKGKLAKNTYDSRNWEYNKEGDYIICPENQKLEFVENQIKITKQGYKKKVKLYRAKNCKSCPVAQECLFRKQNETLKIHNRTVSRNENFLKHVKKAREKLLSEKGKQIRKYRGCEIETVFGDIKGNYQFRRLTHKTLPKVQVELTLHALGHNFRKWLNDLRRKSTKRAVFNPIFAFNTLHASQQRKVA